MFPRKAGRAIALATTLLATLVVVASAPPSKAAHVTVPVIRDLNMANLASSERELHIAVDPNNPNRLMAGANMRGGSPSGQQWYASSDGGRTWTTGTLPYGTLTVPGITANLMSDPALDYGSDGTAYYSALAHGTGSACSLFVTATTDQGANWTDPANGIVAVGQETPATICQDKEFIAVDRANNDNVYVAWTPVGGDTSWEAVFSRDLNGRTDGFAFSAPLVLSTGAAQDNCLNQGTDVSLDSAGVIYVVWTSFCPNFGHGDPGTVWVTRSVDQGATFSAPVQAATLDNVNPTMSTGFRSRSHPAIAADPDGNRVFVVYASNVDAAANDDGDIFMVSSVDGVNWTAPQTVNQDAGTDEQFMPTVDVDNGRVSVIFYSWDDAANGVSQELVYGAVGATPALTQVRISSVSTPETTGFLGDYNGVDTSSADVVFAAWGDGRAGIGGATDGFVARIDFSPPTTVNLTDPPDLPWGGTATLQATVLGAHGEAEQFIPVQFSVSSAGSPSTTGLSAVTDAAGKASFSYSNGSAGTDTVSAWADLDEDGVADAGETTSVTIGWAKHATSIAYTGPSTGTYSDPVTLSGTLTDVVTGTGVAGTAVTLGAGIDTCVATTDGTGTGSCSVAITQPGGSYTATASFPGDAQYLASAASSPFTVLREITAMTYDGTTLLAQGLPATLSVRLVEDDGPAVIGRTVDLVIGAGLTAQTCSGVTDSSGAASCSIVVNQPLGPGVVSAAFLGDPYYEPSSANASTIVFQYTDGGNFVVGDVNAPVGGAITFWSDAWSTLNTPSGGRAPDSFKGFSHSPAGVTTCGGTWQTRAGNSPPPPSIIPTYTAVLVSSTVTKAGAVVTGDKPQLVVISTNPGYAPHPGAAGTGTVLAVLCS